MWEGDTESSPMYSVSSFQGKQKFWPPSVGVVRYFSSTRCVWVCVSERKRLSHLPVSPVAYVSKNNKVTSHRQINKDNEQTRSKANQKGRKCLSWDLTLIKSRAGRKFLHNLAALAAFPLYVNEDENFFRGLFCEDLAKSLPRLNKRACSHIRGFTQPSDNKSGRRANGKTLGQNYIFELSWANLIIIFSGIIFCAVLVTLQNYATPS